MGWRGGHSLATADPQDGTASVLMVVSLPKTPSYTFHAESDSALQTWLLKDFIYTYCLGFDLFKKN